MKDALISFLKNTFCDDDGQANPVKIFSLPPVVFMNVAICRHAWNDPALADHAPYYIGAIVGGWLTWAGAVYVHSLAKK